MYKHDNDYIYYFTIKQDSVDKNFKTLLSYPFNHINIIAYTNHDDKSCDGDECCLICEDTDYFKRTTIFNNYATICSYCINKCNEYEKNYNREVIDFSQEKSVFDTKTNINENNYICLSTINNINTTLGDVIICNNTHMYILKLKSAKYTISICN